MQQDEFEYKVQTFEQHITIKGYFKDAVDNNMIQYISPNPPDYRSSFSGSALPFASEKQAYENTPNFGTVRLIENTFLIELSTPNSFYKDFSNNIVKPIIEITYIFKGTVKTITIPLDSNAIPHRSLTHPEGGRIFPRNLPIRTQEQVLRDSKYPFTTN